MLLRIHKEPGAHYESASTRMYLHGRTETIRSCSSESIEFAKTMLDENAAVDEKVSSLRKAVEGHKNYAKDVSCIVSLCGVFFYFNILLKKTIILRMS